MAAKGVCRRCWRLALSSPTTKQPGPVIHHHPNLTTSAARKAFSTTVPRTIKPTASRTRAAPAPTTSSQQSYNPVPTPGISTLEEQQASQILLRPNNLFHSFTHSPSPQIRRRAAFMRQNAYCSHPDHQATRIPDGTTATPQTAGTAPPAHVRYECPDCGIPVSCSEEHFASDYETHLEVCATLREINEDDHDLVSGRFFPEFDYPGAQIDEAQVNMTNWDTLLYSREFQAVNDERAMRQVTRLLTYPITIGSVLHELSPYGLRNGLTPEGLRSLSGKPNT